MFDLKTETKEIDRRKVSCKQFAVSMQARLATRLGRALAPGLPGIRTVRMASNITALGPAIAELFAHLDDDAAWQLQLDIVKNCTVEFHNQQVKLVSTEAVDQVFGPNVLGFWQTVMFALETNFGPLFERGKALMNAAVQGEQAKESEPPPST